MMVLMRMPLAFADQPFTKPISTIPLLPSNIPNETADHYPQGYAMGYTFSQDGRLFASFFAGKRHDDDHTNSNIRIWDTKTGKLKYQTQIPHYYNSYKGDDYKIKFSSDNKMLYLAEASGAHVFTWHFTQHKTIEVICDQGARAEMFKVVQVASNDKRLLLQGLSYTELCTKELFANKQTRYRSGFYHGDATSVLHKNKLLVIYNKKRSYESSIALNKDELKELAKRKLVDIWQVKPISNAEPLTDIIDPTNQLFIAVEVLDGDLLLHQWNYTKRQRLGTQTFSGLAKPNMQVELHKNYLLIHTNNHFLAVLQKKGLQFSLLWQKQYKDDFNTPELSLDGKYIIAGFDLIETETGKPVSHPIKKQKQKLIKTDYTAYIEYIIKDEGVVNYLSKDLKCQANVNLKSDVYSLLNQQTIQEVDGLIVSMSPDGKMLAACKGSELFLMPIKPH
jgi:hypothetical protein